MRVIVIFQIMLLASTSLFAEEYDPCDRSLWPQAEEVITNIEFEKIQISGCVTKGYTRIHQESDLCLKRSAHKAYRQEDLIKILDLHQQCTISKMVKQLKQRDDV